MTSQIKLPKSTRAAIKRVALHERHAGLQLDKLSAAAEQTEQKDLLQEVCKTRRDDSLLDALLARRREMLVLCHGTKLFAAVTTGSLILHLARASALENAGICLNPIYGFTYLAGSGLKGMARAFAETVWLPAQSDPRLAWRQIEDVFGWASTPDRRAQIKDADHPAHVRRVDDADPKTAEVKEHTGAIIFHDGWPTQWPKLFVDIVNNHHPNYYGATSGDNAHPPGDWENPKPVYFLAVPAGATFEFAVSPRRGRLTASPTACASAAEWLAGALTHLGAGAKTNAGYGAFRIDDSADPALKTAVAQTWQTAKEQKHRDEFTCTLELVTPAFLAGADHEGEAGREGCDLRPATLRGQLRWWWRTMHAGHVDTATLRQMEAAIWGDTEAGGALQITLAAATDSPPRNATLFDKHSYESVGRSDKTGPYGIPEPSTLSPKKITPGIGYLAFGMDDTVRNEDGSKRPRRRFVLQPGPRWTMTIRVRPIAFLAEDRGKHKTEKLSAELILEQAKAALWLLLTYGGIGSKARNGFGSLKSPQLSGHSLAVCDAATTQFRREFHSVAPSAAGHDPTSALNNRAADDVLVDFTRWSDVWTVLEQVGFGVQAFQKTNPHEIVRCALGLPKVFRGGHRGSFEPAEPFRAVYQQADPRRRKHWEKARFASPWHIHLSRLDSGYRVCVTAFVQRSLPDDATSRNILEQFLEFLRRDLTRRAALEPRLMPSIDLSRREGESGRAPCESPAQAQSASVSVPEISTEQLVEQLQKLTGEQVVQRIERPTEASGTYRTQKVTPAPKIPRQYATAAGGKLLSAPPGLPPETFVLAKGPHNQAMFERVIGKFPARQSRKGGRRS